MAALGPRAWDFTGLEPPGPSLRHKVGSPGWSRHNVGHVTTSAKNTPDDLGLDAPRWQRVERVALVRHEVREVLAPSAIDLLFERAEAVVEGDLDSTGSLSAFATVMLTIDLERVAPLIRERPDVATAERIAELLAGHPQVQRRLEALAFAHARDLFPDATLSLQLSLDFTTRAEDSRVLLDADAVVSLDAIHGSSTR